MAKPPNQTIETPKKKLYRAGPDVHQTLTDLVKQYHPDLMSISDQIVVLFKDAETLAQPVIVSKASPKIAVLSSTPCVFTVEIGFPLWDSLNDFQQIALLDRALCAMDVTEDQTGALSFKVRKPDMSYYREEVSRHGFWIKSEKPSDEVLSQLVNNVFGDDSDDSSD